MADADLQLTFSADASGVQTGAAQAASSVQAIKPALVDTQAVVGAFSAALNQAFKGPDTAGLQSAVSAVTGVVAAFSAEAAPFVGLIGAAAVALVGFADKLGQAAGRTQQIAQSFGVSATQAQAFQATADLLGVSVDQVAKTAAASKDAFSQLNGVLDEYGVRNADAGQKGKALSDAINVSKIAGQGFTEVLIQAFAPALTLVVDGLNNVVGQLTRSYASGGALKTIFDILSGTLRLAIAVIVALNGALFTLADISTATSQALSRTYVGAVQIVIAYTEEAISATSALGAVISAFMKGGLADAMSAGKSALQALASQNEATNASVRAALTDTAQSWRGVFGAAGNDVGIVIKQIEALDRTASATLPKVALVNAAPPKPSNPNGANGGSGAAGGSGDALDGKLQADQAEIDAEKGKFAQELAALDQYLADVAARFGKSSDQYKAGQQALTDFFKQHLDQTRQATEQSLAKMDEQYLKSVDQETAAEIKGAQAQLTAQKAAIAEQIEALRARNAMGLVSTAQMNGQIEALRRQEVQDELDAEMAIYNATMNRLRAKYAAMEGDAAAQRDIANQMIALAQDTADKTAKINADGLRQQEQDDLAQLQKLKQQWSAVVDPLVSGFSSGLLQMAEGTKTFAQVMRSIGQQIAEDFLRNVVDKNVENWLWGETARVLATTGGVTQRLLAETTGQSLQVVLASRSVAVHQIAEMTKTGSTAAGVSARTAATVGGASVDMATTGASAMADIATSAAKGAAATWAAVVQAFGPAGPFLAPALAGAALAAILDYKGMVKSAAGGWDQVPYDDMPTLLHKDEMVLSAPIAAAVRGMAAFPASVNMRRPGFAFDGPANDAGANDAGATSVHLHMNMGPGSDGPGLQRWFDQHGDKLMNTVNGKLRGGAKLATG